VLENRYRIDVEVGRGGMGVVYRGTDLTLNRPVAIKALRAQDADATVLSRFLREARSLARVEHPGVVPVYAVGREEGVYYMVMKFVEGRTLQRVLKQEAPLDPERTRKYLKDVCGALSALHGGGLVHRDLKPGNLIVGPDDRVTVMDLGIVKAVGEHTQTTSTALGTPKYMAPEMLNDHNVDARADLYSLGVVAYEMLTGDPPFDGPTPMAILYKQAHEAPEPLRKRAPQVPRALAATVERLLSKDREARFADAESVVAALDGRSSTEAAGGAASPPWRRPGVIVGALATLVGLALLVRALTAGEPPAPPPPPEPATAALPVTAPPSAAAPSEPPAPPSDAPESAPASAPPSAPTTAPPSAAPTQTATPVRLVNVTITSDPTGAQVIENGRPIGRTPLTVKRPQGARAITYLLKRDGFADARVTVTPTSDTRGHARLESMFELVP
jgi:serine/threonine protein kinase